MVDHEIYENTEKQCRFIMKFSSAFMVLLTVVGVIFACSIHAIMCIWRGNYDRNEWFFPMQLCLPFDISTSLGWFLKLLLEFWWSLVIGFTILVVITCFVCGCLWTKALVDQFESMFSKIDAKITSDGSFVRFDQSRFVPYFRKLISLHVKTTE